MIGVYHISNLISYLGLFCAAAGSALAVNGHFDLGLIALVICGICDLFDGKFARSFKRDDKMREFGVQLDSLADAVSFGALPAALLFGLGLHSWYHILLLSLYWWALVTRLGFFNLLVMEEGSMEPVRYYRGLPSTCAALFLPLAGILRFWLAPNVFSAVYTVVMLLLGIFFVVDIRIPKPKGIMYFVFGISAVGIIAAILILR